MIAPIREFHGTETEHMLSASADVSPQTCGLVSRCFIIRPSLFIPGALPYLLHRLVLVWSLFALRGPGAPTKWKAGQWTRLFLWSCQGTWVEKSSHIDIRRWRAKNETLGEKTNDFLLSLVYSVNTFWAWITCAAAFQQMYNCIVLRKFIEIGLLSKHLFMRNRC